MPLIIRPAIADDAPIILQFITELAIYEKAEFEVIASEEHFHRTLFCDDPKAFGLIAELDGVPIGYAIYFYSFSTWLGKYGIYLEDLYVREQRRGLGAGTALLKEIAEIAVNNDCGRIEWSVLDWNSPSIKFYESLGAEPKDGWTVYRLTGDALAEFGR